MLIVIVIKLKSLFHACYVPMHCTHQKQCEFYEMLALHIPVY